MIDINAVTTTSNGEVRVTSREALHILAVTEMIAENDDDKCTRCGGSPVYLGTMCRACVEAARPKGGEGK